MIQYTLLVVGCDHGHHGHYGCIVDHAGCSKITIKSFWRPRGRSPADTGRPRRSTGGRQANHRAGLPLEPESKYFC